MDILLGKTILLLLTLCFSTLTNAKDYLPTIFWNPRNPALDNTQWSKVVNVHIFQTLTFVCPTNLVNIIRTESPNANRESYYNLYVRELSPEQTNLDYDTLCDATKSKYIFSCNQSRNALEFTSKTYKRFQINTKQAHSSDPEFKFGKDYIFFSTSDGRQETLRTNSSKCTMAFRVHFCSSSEDCPISKCATYGREQVCMSEPVLEVHTTAPRDVHITAKTETSLSISWEEPSTTETNVLYYSICYREGLTQDCRTKLAESRTRSTILEDLHSDTEHSIRVRAHTCKGPGDYSEDISEKTNEVVVMSSVSSGPKVTISDITSSSVKVTWEVPHVIEGDVVYYRICCQESQKQECITRLAEPHKRSMVLHDLNPVTRYAIYIRVYTSKGLGNNSKKIEFNTTASEPITSPRSTCNTPTIHVVSLIIGVVIGVCASLIVWGIARQVAAKYRRKLAAETPEFKNKDNTAYRSSVHVDMANNVTNGKVPDRYSVELNSLT